MRYATLLTILFGLVFVSSSAAQETLFTKAGDGVALAGETDELTFYSLTGQE